MTYKNSKKKLGNFMFLSVRCSFLWTEGFSCSLNVRDGGLGISTVTGVNLNFYIKKFQLFSAVIFFNFCSSKSRTQIRTVRYSA